MTISELKQSAREAARRFGIDEGMFLNLIKQESGWRTDAVSDVGAYGIAQFMPKAGAAYYRKLYPEEALRNPQGWRDFPIKQLEMSAALLADTKKRYPISQYGQDAIDMQIAAYNTGETNLDKAIRKGGRNWRDYLPDKKQTLPYIEKIRGRQKDLLADKKEEKEATPVDNFFNRFGEAPVRDTYSFMELNKSAFDKRVKDGFKYLGISI